MRTIAQAPQGLRPYTQMREREMSWVKIQMRVCDRCNVTIDDADPLYGAVQK